MNNLARFRDLSELQTSLLENKEKKEHGLMESTHEGLQVLYQRAWAFLCKNLGASEAGVGERVKKGDDKIVISKFHFSEYTEGDQKLEILETSLEAVRIVQRRDIVSLK